MEQLWYKQLWNNYGVRIELSKMVYKIFFFIKQNLVLIGNI